MPWGKKALDELYEVEILKSQIVISRWGGKRKKPFAFTEYGVAMISSVLRSKRAIQVNIQIMLVFSKIREMLLDTLSMKLDIEEILNLFSPIWMNLLTIKIILF